MRLNAPHPTTLVAYKIAQTTDSRPNQAASGPNLHYFCRACGKRIVSPEVILRPDTEHGAQILCESCGAFLAWTGTVLLRNLIKSDLLIESEAQK